MKEKITIIIAVLALVFSIVSFTLGWLSTRQRQRAAFSMQLVPQFEGKLADWPDAFEFYGVDLKKAKQENISAQQIAYLIMALDSHILFCEAHSMNLSDHLNNYDYARRLFSYPRTRTAWKYARRCISDKHRREIDNYLKNKYGDSHERLPQV